jgi:hypothetical protein
MLAEEEEQLELVAEVDAATINRRNDVAGTDSGATGGAARRNIADVESPVIAAPGVAHPDPAAVCRFFRGHRRRE